jgi:hypothetical protein
MISSLTKKNACRNSVSHPRVEESRSSSAVKGLLRRCRAVSGTERPLLSFPPGVFALRDCTTTYVRVTNLSKHCQSRKNLLKPFQRIWGNVVFQSCLRYIFDQLREDRLKVSARGPGCHVADRIRLFGGEWLLVYVNAKESMVIISAGTWLFLG